MWRPRSLYQVAVIGFLVVWIPLVMAIAYTGYRFDEQAILSNQQAETLVSLTRNNQQLSATLLELERRAGQFLVLRDEDLRKLFTDEHQRLFTLIRQLQGSAPSDLKFQLLAVEETIQKLQLAVLASQPNSDPKKVADLFAELQTAVEQYQSDSTSLVDEQLSSAVDQAAENRLLLIIMTVLLSVITLLSAWYFIRSINRPVKQLEHEILRLGGGDLKQPIHISGPDEMQRLSVQLDWLRKQLAEIDAQKQQFLRHMSHELKTPLASIREGADLMVEEVSGPLKPQQREIVAIMRQNSVELQRLIENLLDYNQMLQQGDLNFTQVLLHDLVEQVIDRYEISILRKQLQLSVSHGDQNEILIDKTKVATVLDNLISNAVNYSPDKGRILLTTGVVNDRLVVEIANDGEPILDREKEAIFTAFFQGSQRRKGAIKGSGIGLAVARECAEIHQGSLQLKPHADYSVCFILDIQLGPQ